MDRDKNIHRYAGRCQLILTAVFFALYLLCFPSLAWIGYELDIDHILQKAWFKLDITWINNSLI